ncbi:MAG: hypothetical protein HYV29_00465 [Ignavibacteriales bacterium]|nr:hypothetical protein [Ignavibacteriales bacterium]
MKNFRSYSLLLILSAMVSAQTRWQELYLPNPLPDTNKASVRFERNVYTYLWTARAQYAYNDSSFYLTLNDQFNSSFIRSQFRSFRDEQDFSFTASKKLSEAFSLASEAQSFVLSDNQTLGTSNAGIHSGAVGITYRLIDNISLTPLLGMRYDKQQFEEDEGMNYRFYSTVDPFEFSGYRTSMNGFLNQSEAGKRTFKKHGAELSIITDFAQGSTDSVRVRWLSNRNDFYIPADSSVIRGFGVTSNIRSRSEQLWGVSNVLGYDVGNGFDLNLSVNVETRTIANAFRYKNLSEIRSISFNTSVQELRLEGGIDLNYVSSSTLMTIGFQLGERDEKHLLERIDGINKVEQDQRARQESKLDNTAVRSTFYSNMSSAISSDDDLSFSGSFSVLQYDTPDSLNTDDRDELLLNLSLKEQHRFSTVFRAALTAEATLSHIVYLKRDKSANNNWNRIFRLSPEMTYTPSRSFTMFNAFEVLANYTVFDFESLIPSVKSYSYRQVAFLDSTSYDMTTKVGIDLFAHVRIYERGELRWREFSERPLQRIEEVTFSPQVRYRFKDQWMFAVGFRSFAQKRFRYVNNNRQYESTFLSAGPTTNIRIVLSAYSLIEIRGWKEFQRFNGGRIQEFSNVMMNVRYFF